MSYLIPFAISDVPFRPALIDAIMHTLSIYTTVVPHFFRTI